MDRPVVFVVTGRSRPHEIIFLLFAVLTGLAYILGAPPPRSAAALMPMWMVYTWAGFMLAHGLVGLIGIFLPLRQGQGLLIELGSMLIGAGALLLFASAAFAYAGWSALLGGGVVVAWAIANLARASQCYRDVRKLRGDR